MTGASAARKAAYEVLFAAHERDAYVRELMNSSNPPETLANLSPEDRAFALRLALGVTSTKGTLDELIERFVTRSGDINPKVNCALRIAAYEMLFLDKAPHAAVSQGVELVKWRAKSAAGFANAVLRRVGEHAASFMAESAAHRFGLPAWLLERVRADLGADAADAFGRACLDPAPVFVANVPMWISDERAPEALGAAGLKVRRCGAVPGAWQVENPSAVARCKLVEEDQVVVTDYGAQAVAFLSAPEPGDRVLEVGSGRGTKTILLAGHAHRARGAARIWALDVHAYKARLASERLQRARVPEVRQVTGDACDLGGIADLPPAFDRILVDAPCSGTGTLRRHPEITWSLRSVDVETCAELQLAMVRSAAARLAPGGMLTYATCSVLREENEDVVAAFLESPEGAGFEVVPIAEAVPEGNGFAVDEMDERSTPEGCLRTYPAPGSCDGHFCACLRRAR